MLATWHTHSVSVMLSVRLVLDGWAGQPWQAIEGGHQHMGMRGTEPTTEVVWNATKWSSRYHALMCCCF